MICPTCGASYSTCHQITPKIDTIYSMKCLVSINNHMGGPALSALSGLSDISDLSDLSDLSDISDLSGLLDLSDLPDLSDGSELRTAEDHVLA